MGAGGQCPWAKADHTRVWEHSPELCSFAEGSLAWPDCPASQLALEKGPSSFWSVEELSNARSFGGSNHRLPYLAAMGTQKLFGDSSGGAHLFCSGLRGSPPGSWTPRGLGAWAPPGLLRRHGPPACSHGMVLLPVFRASSPTVFLLLPLNAVSVVFVPLSPPHHRGLPSSSHIAHAEITLTKNRVMAQQPLLASL